MSESKEVNQLVNVLIMDVTIHKHTHTQTHRMAINRVFYLLEWGNEVILLLYPRKIPIRKKEKNYSAIQLDWGERI